MSKSSHSGHESKGQIKTAQDENIKDSTEERNKRDDQKERVRRRQWHPTPVLLPGKSHGWRSLVGHSPWGRRESSHQPSKRDSIACSVFNIFNMIYLLLLTLSMIYVFRGLFVKSIFKGEPFRMLPWIFLYTWMPISVQDPRTKDLR